MEAQLALTGYVRDLQRLTDNVTDLGSTMKEEIDRASKLNRQGSTRMVILGRRLGKAMEPLVADMERAAREAIEHLEGADGFVQVLAEAAASSDGELDDAVAALVENIDHAYGATLAVAEDVVEVEATLQPLQVEMPNLRQVVDRLIAATGVFGRSADVFERWIDDLLAD